MLPTIVIPAYNRPDSLHRLLTSLVQSHYPPEVRLVIAIDLGGQNTPAVYQLAHQFAWPHGEKIVIQHEQKRGLIGNVFFCGALAKQYGAVILLEDDLVVSPHFYTYAQQATAFFGSDPAVAGISLNALWFNGYTHYPFEPYLDPADTFFLQVAWYQGQVYTAGQWERFETWLAHNNPRVTPADPLHELFQTFPETDWFPIKTKYLVHTNQFYVFPRQSLTTNLGEVGTHFDHTTTFFQVALQNHKTHWHFIPLEQSVAVYDSFHELLPGRLNRLLPTSHPLLSYEGYTVDLYGTKTGRVIHTPYLLTTQPATRPLHQFGLALRPLEANVQHQHPGRGISFTAVNHLSPSRWASWQQKRRLHDYFARSGRVSLKQLLWFWLLRRLGR